MSMICEHCGHEGEPVVKKPGSTWIQVVLFVLGLLTFGVVLIVWAGYAIWRIVKTEPTCPSCGRPKTMISLESPRGRKLKKEFEVQSA